MSICSGASFVLVNIKIALTYLWRGLQSYHQLHCHVTRVLAAAPPDLCPLLTVLVCSHKSLSTFIEGQVTPSLVYCKDSLTLLVLLIKMMYLDHKNIWAAKRPIMIYRLPYDLSVPRKSIKGTMHMFMRKLIFPLCKLFIATYSSFNTLRTWFFYNPQLGVHGFHVLYYPGTP